MQLSPSPMAAMEEKDLAHAGMAHVQAIDRFPCRTYQAALLQRCPMLPLAVVGELGACLDVGLSSGGRLEDWLDLSLAAPWEVGEILSVRKNPTAAAEVAASVHQHRRTVAVPHSASRAPCSAPASAFAPVPAPAAQRRPVRLPLCPSRSNQSLR